MKKSSILQSLICLLAVSCSVNELDMQVPTSSEDEAVFYASLESYSDPESRVYVDENIKIFWDEADQISVFNKSTLNQQYKFNGETGDNSGEFHKVSSNFGAGNDLDYICAVYPYLESTTISNSNVLTLNLPEEQLYRAGSFGPNANTMVSVTNDHHLRFKNVGGYMVFKLCGQGVSVSSITLVGHQGEKLSGEATWEPDLEAVPESITMASTAGTSITLKCDEPVDLADAPTLFWFVVPPQTRFGQGFRLLVTDPRGNVFIKDTSKDLTIPRNEVVRFTPIDVTLGSEVLSIESVSSADQAKLPSMTDFDETKRTFTVTMPTPVLSRLVLDYEISEDYSLLANGMDVIPGETPIDASKPVTLTVRNGNHGKNYTLIARNTGLPIVRITLKNITLDALEDEDNSLDSDDGKDHRIWHSGNTVRIENADGSPGMNEVLSDGYSKVPAYQIETEIKGRGNYTWRWDKKPYALRLDKKREVLGMPAHKRWILLANWRDRTLLRNDVTFELSRRAGLPYTVRGEFVELEIDGEYRGNYYLCEQIKIDENRVNIRAFDDDFTDLTGGYLMEIDSYFDEVNKFHSEYFKLNYMFKEPDDDPKAEGTNPAYALGYAWMESHINEFEKSLKTKSAVEKKEYEKYLDVDSSIEFLLVNELSGNRDFFQGAPHSGPHSTYLYKDKGGKLFMGPGWDFDYETYIPYKWYDGRGYAKDYKWRGFDNSGYYYYFLCHNPYYVDRIKTIWNLKQDSFKGLTDYIDGMVRKIGLSQQFDEALWRYDPDPTHWLDNHDYRNDNHDYYEDGDVVPFQTAIARMKSSLTSKITWMNTQIQGLQETEPTSGYYSWGRWIEGEWLRE